MNKEIIILCGIPCSGKSTFRNEEMKKTFTRCVSRDDLRAEIFPGKYKFSSDKEDKVTEFEGFRMKSYTNTPSVKRIIIDNTHCKEKYLDNLITKYGKNNTIRIKFFYISLWKAHYRNITRFIGTGKWIPIKVINTMYKNFNKINKSKYERYA